MKLANSVQAKLALEIVNALQARFVKKLEELSAEFKLPVKFSKHEWLRDAGKHGGGNRLATGDNPMFNRASVNISQVQYETNPAKPLNSATALSTIIHPDNPLAPSVHMHFSFTELKQAGAYWRLMADLNPAQKNQQDTDKFINCLKQASGQHFAYGTQQGDKYFYIPGLDRTRGVAHFYLENFTSGNQAKDATFTKNFAKCMIDCYVEILSSALKSHPDYSETDSQQQLDYHTLYLFQVLTLDRGTTSGLLVHNQNDTGIMGSLPKAINRKLLESWVNKMPQPQDKLLANIVSVLPAGKIIHKDDKIKQALANVLRSHYQKYPQALDLQAKGDVVPPTVANHK